MNATIARTDQRVEREMCPMGRAGLDRSFFVHGPVHRTEFGGAPLISFNGRRPTDIEPGPGWPSRYATLFEEVLKIGFFWYGPPEWQVGINENLDLLMHVTGREKVIDRILQACLPARRPDGVRQVLQPSKGVFPDGWLASCRLSRF